MCHLIFITEIPCHFFVSFMILLFLVRERKRDHALSALFFKIVFLTLIVLTMLLTHKRNQQREDNGGLNVCLLLYITNMTYSDTMQFIVFLQLVETMISDGSAECVSADIVKPKSLCPSMTMTTTIKFILYFLLW